MQTDAVSSSEIVVMWTAPVVPLEFTLLSYSVCLRFPGVSGCQMSFSPDNMTLAIVVEGLYPEEQYETIVAPVIQEDFFIRNRTSLATTFPECKYSTCIVPVGYSHQLLCYDVILFSSNLSTVQCERRFRTFHSSAYLLDSSFDACFCYSCCIRG